MEIDRSAKVHIQVRECSEEVFFFSERATSTASTCDTKDCLNHRQTQELSKKKKLRREAQAKLGGVVSIGTEECGKTMDVRVHGG